MPPAGRAPPACSCIRRVFPAGSRSVTSARPPSRCSTGWSAPASLSGRSCRWGPTGMGDSPYNSLSAFAGNPLLISPEALVADGLAAGRRPDALGGRAGRRASTYPAAASCKESLLRQAFLRFESGELPDLAAGLERFADQERRAVWLDDWALYASLKRDHAGASWLDWEPGLPRPGAAGAGSCARPMLAGEIRFAVFCQFLFFRQWSAVRRAAESRGIRILGDVPIYVAPDSADTWANSAPLRSRPGRQPARRRRRTARLLQRRRPALGQSALSLGRAAGRRLPLVDRRASGRSSSSPTSCGSITSAASSPTGRSPSASTTARRGKWVKGPGEDLLPRPPARAWAASPCWPRIWARSTRACTTCGAGSTCPGCASCSSASAPLDSDHSPHRHEPRAAVYTGTHDNDTTRGWFAERRRRRAPARPDLPRGDAGDHHRRR